LIFLNAVSKTYGAETVVDQLTLEVATGELCVLIGLSGCGKSTTLKMINRLIEPTAGSVFINGAPVVELKPEQLRRKIGYVIQNIGLFPHWTVEKNIAVVPNLLRWDRAKIKRRVNELLDLFDLDPDIYLNKYPDQLSGGQAQRVGVARALAADPDILLMDEPFGSLDPITRETLQLELVRVHRELKKTIVFVTHDIDEGIRLSDKIAVMNKGKVIQFDTPEKILTNPASQFVHEFIGTDRGLRRLSRLAVKDYIQAAVSVRNSDTIGDVAALLKREKYVWVTGKDNKLKGWLESSTATAATDKIEKYYVPIDATFPLHEDNLLKEAVSRMLWQSVQTVPVVDQEFKLVGEIRFSDLLTD